MHDINHALSVIKDALGLPGLDLNGNGQAEIVFAGGFSAYLTKIAETVVELSFRLPGLDAADAEMMRAMLQANSLGAGVGAGRLAIDGDRDETIYCVRWNVADMTAASVESGIREFAQYAAFWASDGTDAILEEAMRLKASSAPAPDIASASSDEDDEVDESGSIRMREPPFFVRA